MTSPINKSIFLADDDEDDCLLFEDALREVCATTELTMANDGAELISLMETNSRPCPDVIFLDLNMPKKNGFECLEVIRKTKKWSDIPVVVFSTTGQEEMIKKVYELGANYFIRKPGSYPKLLQAIRLILDMDWTKHKARSLSEKVQFQY